MREHIRKASFRSRLLPMVRKAHSFWKKGVLTLEAPVFAARYAGTEPDCNQFFPILNQKSVLK